MRAMTRRRLTVVAGVSLVAAFGLTSGTASAGPVVSPVLTGLNAPRGIAFDGQGSMYVSESGQWTPGAPHLTSTGRVSKYAWTSAGPSSTAAWQTMFQNMADAEHGPEVLGPEGISAIGNGCMKRSNGMRNGCQVRMIMSESTPGLTGMGLSPTQMGHLFRLDGASGAATDLSDVGSQEWAWTTANSSLVPDQFPDSNPYGVLVTTGADGNIHTYVADAGANTISEVMSDGTLRVIAFIPNDAFSDSTPTCIAQGPDGMLYVGTLDFAANSLTFGPGGPVFNPGSNPGHSSVWVVDPNANYPSAATVWATGLTTVTSCTFDRSGNFWATEMFQPAAGPPGDVVKIPFSDPTSLTRIGGGMLPVPGGIAQGPDGAMYVTVGSASVAPNSGAVVRIAN